MRRRLAVLALSALAWGCGGKPAQPAADAGVADAGGPDAGTLHTTYRVVGGVSMGAIGSSTVGLHHPELFDAVTPLGGPMDLRYFGGHFMEHTEVGGFCPLARLEAQLDAGPAELNDPAGPLADCMQDVPATVSTEHTQSFNHWRFTTSGGHFTRSSYLELMADLSLAFGNLTSYNPDSPYAPLGLSASQSWSPPADICTNPIRIKGKLSDPAGHPIYNKEYNPEGKYDAITFCDGEESPIYYCSGTMEEVDFCAGGAGVANPIRQADALAYATTFCQGKGAAAEATDASGTSDAVLAIYAHAQGRFDPCREHTDPFRVGLAFDLNGNGRRDYAEPLAINIHERYRDVGADGCPDELEDGHGGCVSDPAQSPHASGVADPNGDDYDLFANPQGTENNWGYDVGEPSEDCGLDGVCGTGDYGEGDGKYTESPNLTRLRSYDPRSNYERLTPEQRKLLDLYVDGGRRDVFNLGVDAQVLWGLVAKLNPAGQSSSFQGFGAVPNVDPTPADPDKAQGLKARWDQAGRNVLQFYGTPDATITADQLKNGDGDHVGTVTQALDRFQFLETWVANRWPNLPLPPKPPSPGDFNDRLLTKTYFSQALNSNRDYTIYLPPGYFDPSQAGQHYPVLYLMHGYGMKEADFAASSIALFEVPMTSTDRTVPALNTRKYITVFVSGRCCFTNSQTGERDCTNAHDGAAGWVGSCSSGSFYVNAAGMQDGGGDRYEDSLLDLITYVDENYRTLPAAEVVAR